MQHSKKNTENEFGLSKEIVALLQNVFARFVKIEKVKIFGSRAMGNHHSGSDIDLSFFSKSFSHDDFLRLHVAIDDLDLLYKIDLVNYSKIENPDLKKHIDLEGKDFYRAVNKETV